MYKYIINLGEDCFMRSLIDRYNLRTKFPIRMPFDGSIHPYEEVCRLIESDFSDYTDDILVNNNIFYNNNGVLWNHEKTTDIISFKTQLSKRVEQFKKVLNEGKKILFVLHHKNKDIAFNFNIITNALKLKYPDLQFHIFVFNNYHLNTYISKTINTTYVNILWNPKNITNFKDIDYNNINNDFISQLYVTPYGVEFSLKVMKEICYVLNEDYTKFRFVPTYNFSENI